MRAMQNVRKLYALRFFSGLIPAYVIERLFWEARGMTVPMVVSTEILYAAAVALTEVPLGVAADKWGRKRMLVLSAVIGCCEFLFLVFATEYWHFALVVALTAIGRSASSGAEDALLYDSLSAAGRANEFEAHVGRLNALDIAAVMLAALSGSLLAERFGFEWNYWLSFGSMTVAAVLALSLSEPDAVGRAEDGEPDIPLRTYVTASLRLFRRDRGLLLAVLSGTVVGAAVNFVDEFWQIYLDRLGVPVAFFGLASATLFLLRLPGNLLADRLRRRFRYRTLFASATAAFAVCFAALAAAPKLAGFAALALVGLFAGAVEPLATGYLHRRADSAMRATMGSFQSLIENAALVAVGIGFGYASSSTDIFGGFGFLAAVCGAWFVAFFAASRGVVE